MTRKRNAVLIVQYPTMEYERALELADELVRQTTINRDTSLGIPPYNSSLWLDLEENQGIFPMRGTYYYEPRPANPIDVMLDHLGKRGASEFVPESEDISCDEWQYDYGVEARMIVKFESREKLAEFIQRVLPDGKIV